MTNLIEKARLGRQTALSGRQKPSVQHGAMGGERVAVRHVPATFISARARMNVVNIFA